jgi:hypothetical protein
VAVADWDGETTVIFASATGLPFVLSVSVPVMLPVVPASAHVPWASIASIIITATNACRSLSFGMVPP